MGLKQVNQLFLEISVIALLLIGLSWFLNSGTALNTQRYGLEQSERSFEEEAQHHSKFLVAQAPAVHFYLKEQICKRFYNVFIQSVCTHLIAGKQKAVKAYYGTIRYYFFLKHQRLLFPFHFVW